MTATATEPRTAGAPDAPQGRPRSRWRLTPRLRFAGLVAPAVFFLGVFLLLPLATTFVVSFWRTESYTLVRDWNIHNYALVLTDWTYTQFLVRSLMMATAVSAICVIIAWPVAWFIVTRGGKYKLPLLLLTAAPFLTGVLLRVMSMQQLLGPTGLINSAITSLGLPPVRALLYTDVATLIGLVYLWVPFMVLAIYLSLLNFDLQLMEVAKVNGASPMHAFFQVALPLNWMGTVIGIVLVFIPTLAETVTAQFLGGINGTLFGNILTHQFGATGTWALGAAMGVVLFATSLIVMLLLLSTVRLRRSGFTGQET